MTSRTLGLTRDQFSQSYFQIGSGTCLQPLLRYTDQVSEFVFIDYEPNGSTFYDNLLAAEQDLHCAAGRLGIPNPLRLEDIQRFDNLQVEDFDLVMSPSECFARLRDILRTQEFEEFMREFRPEPPVRQWGLSAQVVRSIAQVNGEPIQRRRQLRVFGGEGLLTYIGMGGLVQPPPIVATVQTGVLELHDSPLARIFQDQSRQGTALPGAWVRGQMWSPTSTPLRPAPPFSIIGQAYVGWVADRDWPQAPCRSRVVNAWIQSEHCQTELRVGPHRIVRRRAEAQDVHAHCISSLPRRVAGELGVAERASVHVHDDRQEGPLRHSLTQHLHEWQERTDFKRARSALLVPSGLEDEMHVLITALRDTSVPAITVHLPLTMDFEAAARCLQDA